MIHSIYCKTVKACVPVKHWDDVDSQMLITERRVCQQECPHLCPIQKKAKLVSGMGHPLDYDHADSEKLDAPKKSPQDPFGPI